MTNEFIIKVLENDQGFSPFEKWYYSLKDQQVRRRILLRIKRISLGNLGDWKGIGDKIFELRIDTGPGYRIYLSRIGDTIIVLLGGGDKSSQEKDIKKAIKLWEDYQNETQGFLRDF